MSAAAILSAIAPVAPAATKTGAPMPGDAGPEAFADMAVQAETAAETPAASPRAAAVSPVASSGLIVPAEQAETETPPPPAPAVEAEVQIAAAEDDTASDPEVSAAPAQETGKTDPESAALPVPTPAAPPPAAPPPALEIAVAQPVAPPADSEAPPAPDPTAAAPVPAAPAQAAPMGSAPPAAGLPPSLTSGAERSLSAAAQDAIPPSDGVEATPTSEAAAVDKAAAAPAPSRIIPTPPPAPAAASEVAALKTEGPAPLAPAGAATTPATEAAPTVQTAPALHSGLSHAAVEATAQIAAQILRRLDARQTRFEMVLTPEDLGRVDVSLDVDSDGRLAARLAFDNPAAAADLRGRADELRRQLTEAGFQLADDALDFAERDANAFSGERGFDRDRGGARAFAGGARVTDQADRAASRPPAWISLQLTPDRVDMRV
ncbi:flagellar hook-length control protein FliK [Brevundimonas sp.]|uniref:flagellar hook-length control protein FliK n=1 Tax=Brevundimonas sp. TaxID=1871086 RepID=UPI0025BD0CAA|nr:flagellar hook-length control protein FliK [Brevundimonas sp.]